MSTGGKCKGKVPVVLILGQNVCLMLNQYSMIKQYS